MARRQWIELKDVEWEDCKQIKAYLDERNADYGLVNADPYGLKEGWWHHITIKPSWNLMRDFREDLKKMGINVIPIVETYEIVYSGCSCIQHELINSYELE